eukprot:13334735-Alexandrium_andersonii.AAC.1
MFDTFRRCKALSGIVRKCEAFGGRLGSVLQFEAAVGLHPKAPRTAFDRLSLHDNTAKSFKRQV